jgi:MOSC domain-containing protein YiiM
MREVEHHGELVRTGIWKFPVSGRVRVAGVNVDGDEQADLSVHGGPDKAVYAYATEDYDWWSGELGRDLSPGTFGENLTTRGVEVTHAVVGERWRVGDVLLEVSEPRLPCWKLALRMGDPRFLKRFAGAMRPGAYLRIVEPGELAAGDAVELVSVPDHGVTIEMMARFGLGEHSLASALLEAPELSANWRNSATRRA